MKDGDDWSLGDEPEARCIQCGKRNRAGLRRCVFCGTPLIADLEADQDSLRTIGEVMGSGRSRRGKGRQRGPLQRWAWPLAALGLLVLATVLYWMGTREERHLVLPRDVVPPVLVAPPTAERQEPGSPARLTPMPEPRATERPPEQPSPSQPEGAAPAVTVGPDAPPPATVPSPVSVPAGTRRRLRPAPTKRSPVPRALPTPGSASAGTLREPAPRVPSVPSQPSDEKPSVGTDLREATLAYRAAIETHNARVDEYNAIADEIQRRQAWDDSRESRALRARLERARAAVERTRADAEAMRVRMENVRARYR